jgi:hypothetical protein
MKASNIFRFQSPTSFKKPPPPQPHPPSDSADDHRQICAGTWSDQIWHCCPAPQPTTISTPTSTTIAQHPGYPCPRPTKPNLAKLDVGFNVRERDPARERKTRQRKERSGEARGRIQQQDFPNWFS